MRELPDLKLYGKIIMQAEQSDFDVLRRVL